MALSFLYLAFRALLGALVHSRRGVDVKDLELLVLRHEVEVLRRFRLRSVDRCSDDLDPLAAEDLVEGAGELRVAIVDQEAWRLGRRATTRAGAPAARPRRRLDAGCSPRRGPCGYPAR